MGPSLTGAMALDGTSGGGAAAPCSLGPALMGSTCCAADGGQGPLGSDSGAVTNSSMAPVPVDVGMRVDDPLADPAGRPRPQ